MNRAIPALLVIAGAAGAEAQFGNPGFANPSTPGIETGKPTDDAANAVDQTFIRQASIGNRAEVELGNLAMERATAAPVKAFAERMVSDHREGVQAMQSLAREKGTPLPRDLDMDHNVVLGQLRDTEQAQFDIAYIRSQLVDHQRTAQLLQYVIGGGQSAAVRSQAQEMLPIVMEHLSLAKQIHADLTGAAP